MDVATRKRNLGHSRDWGGRDAIKNRNACNVRDASNTIYTVAATLRMPETAGKEDKQGSSMSSVTPSTTSATAGTITTTANKGPMRIQYKCLVPIYVFPEMRLFFPKQNYNVLSPSSCTHKSLRD
jgi:hypothetical protein